MMKKINFILGLAVLLVLAACEPKSELTPILKIGPAPAISSPAVGATIALDEANADNVMPDFTWSAADFGFQAAVSYSLEVAKAGTDFADPILVGKTNSTSITGMTEGEFNSIMIANGVVGDANNDMEMRVKAEINPNVDPVYSDVIAVTVNPYKVVIIYPQLGVPGSYQGWNPGDSTTAVFSRKSDGVYEGFLYFDNPGVQYKFTQGPDWATNWGDDGADGTLDPSGADIASPGQGMVRLTADLNDLTHAAEVTNWGLIGSATPGSWDSDQDLTYDAATGNLIITLDLVAGEIKFRANDDWAIDFGDTDANGSLEYGGDNIAIAEAGNYTIELILQVADYTYTVTKN
jgi:hypothetical protein